MARKRNAPRNVGGRPRKGNAPRVPVSARVDASTLDALHSAAAVAGASMGETIDRATRVAVAAAALATAIDSGDLPIPTDMREELNALLADAEAFAYGG